jgi:hypothetical protein
MDITIKQLCLPSPGVDVTRHFLGKLVPDFAGQIIYYSYSEAIEWEN